ncbi:MAG: nitroreductase family protein [Firmicutes bacterium]|jgi:nitroreductase|nr:nitroreductase family protein [Bacillota bacterium]
MDAIEAIKTRRSVRRYLPTPVPREVIEDIVDCGRMAPTARGDQPWEFIVVTDQKTREALAAVATWGKFIADAPVCVAVFARPTPRYVEDCSAAVENMLLAAHAHGLGTCWVAGHDTSYAPEIGRILGVPTSHRLVALFPVGYHEDKPIAHKRSLSDVLHWERY